MMVVVSVFVFAPEFEILTHKSDIQCTRDHYHSFQEKGIEL